EDTKTLTRLPGIGKKTAERLLIEMRDRVKTLNVVPSAIGTRPAAVALTESPQSKAVSALISLGYKPAEATRLLQGIDGDDMSTEQMIRLALQKAVRELNHARHGTPHISTAPAGR